MNLREFQTQLLRARHRSLCILSGSNSWQSKQLNDLQLEAKQLLWISQSTPPKQNFAYQVLAGERLKYHLGQEIDGAILTLEDGLDANQLGILSGMIRAGGLLIILTPNTDWWQLPNPANARFLNSPLQPNDAFHDFYQHLHRTWQQTPCLWLTEDTHSAKPKILCHFQPVAKKQTLGKNSPQTPTFKPTVEQSTALQKIHTVAFGHRKRPLVLSADRGRGKSAILGIAAIELLLAGKNHIVVTSSRIDQAEKIFEHANKWLDLPQNAHKVTQITLKDLRKGKIEFQQQTVTKCLEFIAPDELVLQPTTADILMVDEAAFLPTPLLTELVKRHHRMVFATTLHGYEGSGRGFEIRFKQTLNELTPDWKTLHLQQPIRWAENDPLEQSINRALLLNIELQTKLPDSAENALHITQTNAQQLLANPKLLEATFALLVQAHYQTSPNDLQQLLSAPNLRILICHSAQLEDVVGVCLATAEGQIDGKAKATNQQHHGHLVPQLLSRFYNTPSILPLKSLRIMRIAVHPQLQQSGIGSRLIQHLIKVARAERIDYLSSSFGVHAKLFCFWHKHQFKAVHLSTKRDKASGQHNLVVMHPMSPIAQKITAETQQSFQQQFPHLLIENLPYFPSKMVWLLLATFRFRQGASDCRQTLNEFANKIQTYEAISGKLWQISLQLGDAMLKLSPIEQNVWCDKILKKHSWADVAHQYHLAGKKAVEDILLTTANQLLQRNFQAMNSGLQGEQQSFAGFDNESNFDPVVKNR